MSNLTGFFICIVYIFGMIGLAEALRRRLGYGSAFTRKVIHIGVGSLSWALPWLFDNPWPFVVAALGFAILNFLDWRYSFFPAMDSDDATNLGTVYFPLAAAVVVYIFWNQPPLMVASLMPLAWGDGLAPVIGRAFGKHAYHVLGHRRTLEGSLAFFAASSLFVWLALWLMPGPPEITPAAALLPALVISAIAALVEAVSIWGLDNLTVTATAMLLVWAWPF
jgi:phytol kinase